MFNALIDMTRAWVKKWKIDFNPINNIEVSSV